MGDLPTPPGGEFSAATEIFVLEIPSDLRLVESTAAYLVNRCRDHVTSDARVSFNLRVGVMEALANAILYGNQGDPAKRVRIATELAEDSVRVEITDQGSGFDPYSVPDPTLPENLQRPGGRGVFLIRQLMDEVEYGERGNSVRLVLYRDAPSRQAAGS